MSYVLISALVLLAAVVLAGCQRDAASGDGGTTQVVATSVRSVVAKIECVIIKHPQV